MSLLKKIRNAFANSGSNEFEAIVREYNNTRSIQDRALLCHAPFSNLYFNTEGDVALCWQTFHRAEKYSEEKSLKDIWNGLNFQRIREGIRNHQMDYGCQACKNHLLEKNYTNILAKAYDNDFPKTDYPSIIEFELSNTCNLACTMCNGMLSSIIRREREKLEPLKSPYGEKFLTEIREFIPHLHEARFNGGEPFLIKNYFRIWEIAFELNPSLKMVIATNGTVLNQKVKDTLAKGNFHLNISMDGATKATYESIRINGEWETMMENFLWFLDYCKSNKRTLCIMVNPLRQNWREMPVFLNFVNKHNVHIWFNTIMKPAEQALWSLPAKDLENIYTTLASAALDGFSGGDENIYKYNVNTYHNLVQQQIKTWWEQAKQHKTEVTIDDADSVKAKALKKITAYLATRAEDKITVQEKIYHTEMLIDEPLRDSFFKSLLDSNPETITAYCRKYNSVELKELFINHLGEKK